MNNAPSAPNHQVPPTTNIPQKSSNNIRFSVSCSANDVDSDASF